MSLRCICTLCELQNSSRDDDILVLIVLFPESDSCRLISQVANEIWIVGDNTVKRWDGDITEYKEHLKKIHESYEE